MNKKNLKTKQKIVIDKDFFNIFLPFYYIKRIACVRSYNVNRNYVESISGKNIICAVLANCVMAGLYFTIILGTIRAYGTVPYVKMYYTTYFIHLCNYFSASVVNLYNSKICVRLLAVLYEIESIESQEELRTVRIISWSSCILFAVYYIALVLFKIYFDMSSIYGRGVFIIASIVYDFEVNQGTLVVLILTRKLIKMIEYIKSINFGNERDDIRVDRDAEQEYVFNEIKSILKAWDLLKKIIQVHVSNKINLYSMKYCRRIYLF